MPSDDVEEADCAAAVLDMPPEVFDVFLAHDVRAAIGSEQYAFDYDAKAHVVPLDTPLNIVLTMGQENVRAIGHQRTLPCLWNGAACV